MQRDIALFRAVYHSSAANYDNTGHLVTVPAELPWISGGAGNEWLLLDLGTESKIQRIEVRWGTDYAQHVKVEVSPDRETWTEAGTFSGVSGGTSEIEVQAAGHFLRLTLTGCSGEHYIIYRLRVFGEQSEFQERTGQKPAQISSPASDNKAEYTEEGRQNLSGNDWQVRRASEISQDDRPAPDGPLGRKEREESPWLPAVVPGTVLTSYLLAGAVPDPFYDDDQFQVSEAYFTADFWYRKTFRVSEKESGKRVFLNFDSINWKADVYLNGTYLPNTLPGREHSIEGAFIRAQFDVTDLISFEKENVLSVLILKNATPGPVTTQGLAYGPGPNGGPLGADNPTIHAAVGWDWLPTIRGRNTGITGEVSLSFGSDVQLSDPWMETELKLISETTAIPLMDLMQGEVLTDGEKGPVREWHGRAGSSFTVDFGVPVPIGTVTLLWGTESGGAAADLESRYPEQFSLEVSEDGTVFRNLDAYAGGPVEIQWLGLQEAPAHEGSGILSGHAVSDTLPGATAHLTLDLSRFGRGTEKRALVKPEKARFLRFSVISERKLNGRAVDTIVREMRVYAESPEQVEQAIKHSYDLDTSKAYLKLHTEVLNRCGREEAVTVSGRILPDGPVFSEKRVLSAEEKSGISIPLVLPEPRLWWPNTYGEQPLYSCEIEISQSDRVLDRKKFSFGVRRFDYPIEGGLLTLYCNGTRIVAKGGNWGLDEGMKRDNSETLHDKVRLHAEANMTMIRNWVGMTDHPAFYKACDLCGILIWDDFWLANPVDGPEPDDPEMFLQNAADKIRRVRSHPSLVFYCGRNEGNPREDIDLGLRKLTEELDGTRIYFPNSAAPPVGSGGGYSLAKPGQDFGVKQYFNDVTSSVLRSERGIPNVPELDSVKKFVRPEHLWPISETWALHDWTYHMNGPANTYMEAIKNYLGGDFEVPEDLVQGAAPDEHDPVFRKYREDIAKMCREAAEAWSLEAFFKTAQLINFDHHRGMFDAISAKLSNGLLMWMSQSSWPSFMWQTYDYYLSTNGGYFGAKAGCQAVRAFLDPRDGRILLSNASPKAYRDLLLTEELYNLYGEKVLDREYEISEFLSDAYGIPAGTADYTASDTDTVFLRLTLRDSAGNVLGQNTYWHNRKEYQNYQALLMIPKAEVSLRVVRTESVKGLDGRELVRAVLEVENGEAPSLGTRIRLLPEDGADILPVFYSDNYLLLMPGEKRTVTAEYYPDRLHGEGRFTVTSWNA